jgi:hypothetical protein
MKKLLNLLFVVLCFASCKKDLPVPDNDTPATGKAQFWLRSDIGCGKITVIVDGVTKVLDSYFTSGYPGCDAANTAIFELAPGTYPFTASCSGRTWQGNVTVVANQCTPIELTLANSVSGGGGGGGGTTTGQGMFWIASDLGCGTINVSINGVTRSITSFYSSGAPASCGATGTATFSLNPGTYNYTASCTGLTWSGTITITSGGCTKIQLNGGGGGGGGTTAGQGMFWIASDLGCGTINVSINGVSRSITSFYSSGAPANCGATGTATFSLNPGTYNYTASCTGKTWSGTITITSGGCTKIQLTGGSNSGGGGTTTGQGMFWIASDLGCGTINVSINGVTRSITSFFSSGAPSSCGASGTATFSLNPGTYNYSASCSGKTWSGTISITSGGCSRIQLTGGSNSGGGGTSTGNLMFFSRKDHGCGVITVTVNGSSRAFTNFYPSGDPACGAQGGANFTFAPGTYSYSAKCSSKTWNGTVTVTANGCSRIVLN